MQMKLARDWSDFGGDATDLEIAFAVQLDSRLVVVESAPLGNVEHDDREMDGVADLVLDFITEVRKGMDFDARVLLCAEWAAVAWEHANALYRRQNEAPFWESQVKNHWTRLTLVQRFFLVKFGYADVNGVPTSYAVNAGRRF